MAFLISTTSPVLILSFSASGSPRSTYTLPELRCTSIPSISRFFPSQLLCKRLGDFQPGANDVDVPFWRGDPALALLLEAVQDEHGFLELHGVDGAIRAAGIVCDNLERSSAPESVKYLR